MPCETIVRATGGEPEAVNEVFMIFVKCSLQYFGLMNHDMYPLTFYFVLIGAPKQLGVFNDLFLIVDKEINMLRTVMHHIRFDFFCQL